MIEALLIGLVVWFLFKVYTSVRDARRRARDLFSQFGGQPRQESGSRKAGWSNSAPQKRKKIDRTVGEYVEFEEIAETHTETHTRADGSSYRSETTEVEQQITDVEWEDIK